MDWLTFFVRIIEALTWPSTVLAVVLLLKTQVIALFPFLKRLKAGPVEAEFERQVEEIKNEAPWQLPSPDRLPLVDARRQQLIQIAQINPRAAILDAWQGIEFAVKKAGLQRIIGSPAPDISSPLRVVRALAQEQIIGPEEVSLFHDLRGLRNQATHAPDFSPTYESALNYIELAARLQTKFEELSNVG